MMKMLICLCCSGQLIAELVRTLRSVGREPATVQETLAVLKK